MAIVSRIFCLVWRAVAALSILILVTSETPLAAASPFDGKWAGRVNELVCSAAGARSSSSWKLGDSVSMEIINGVLAGALGDLKLRGTVDGIGKVTGSGTIGDAVFTLGGRLDARSGRLTAEFMHNYSSCSILMSVSSESPMDSTDDPRNLPPSDKSSAESRSGGANAGPLGGESMSQADASKCSAESVEKRLRAVADLLSRGLISASEADAKKREILGCL